MFDLLWDGPRIASSAGALVHGTAIEAELQMATQSRDVWVETGSVALAGVLTMPEGSHPLVVFAHGSGSRRERARSRFVAQIIDKRLLGTLSFDLLSPSEAKRDRYTGALRFDVELLGKRLTGAVDWLASERRTARARIGLFGSSTSAACALIAAANRPALVGAVVCRGGRPDLVAEVLPRIRCPVLFIVGGKDDVGVRLNVSAAARMEAAHELRIVPGATHLFEEPGKLEAAATLAAEWFEVFLRPEQPGEISAFEHRT